MALTLPPTPLARAQGVPPSSTPCRQSEIWLRGSTSSLGGTPLSPSEGRGVDAAPHAVGQGSGRATQLNALPSERDLAAGSPRGRAPGLGRRRLPHDRLSRRGPVSRRCRAGPAGPRRPALPHRTAVAYRRRNAANHRDLSETSVAPPRRSDATPLAGVVKQIWQLKLGWRCVGGNPARATAPKGPNPIAQAAGLGDRVRVTRSQGPTGRDSRRPGVTARWALCCAASAFVPGRWPGLSSSAPSGQDSSSSVDATLSETASTDPALGAGACNSFTASPLRAIETFSARNNSGRSTGRRTAKFLAAQATPSGRSSGRGRWGCRRGA